ncbi:MAG: CRISPR-associated helicase Cas3' [bacterium]|nr:CRISPR-associated helicase Cas3' [bacterium]
MSPEDLIAHFRSSDHTTQLLVDHLTAVASLARQYAAKIGCPNSGEAIGLGHDTGKAGSIFQNYLRSAVGLLDPDQDADYLDTRHYAGKIDHSTAGAQLMWRSLSKGDKQSQVLGQVLALCISSHHSGLIDALTPDGKDRFSERMGKDDAKTHCSEAFEKLQGPVLDRICELLADPETQGEVARLLRQIWERDRANEIVVRCKAGLAVRFLFSCLIDADRVDSADFEAPQGAALRGQHPGWEILIDRLEAHLDKIPDQYPIDPLRREISAHCRSGAVRDQGLFSLSVPTGGGKTLASLRFALHHARRHGLDRVIYVVPFTTIIDQNAQSVRNILDPQATGSIVLEHHSNLLPEKQTWQHKLLSANWDAPIVFTTSVQFLEALFGSGTRSARRMHQLAKSLLVFDEVQSLPIKTLHLFNNGLNLLVEQCGSTAILCTATQPLLDKIDPAKGALALKPDAELMPEVLPLFKQLERVKVLPKLKPAGWKDEEVAHLAQAEVLKAGSCLAVVNTKKSAQSLFRLCQGNADYPVFHLSTHQCPAHRKDLLEKIKALLVAEKPVLCISTQLIEAGVDVDFGSVIRCLAGLDSIAQAAGRCNRNGKGKVKGEVHVVNLEAENLGPLEEIAIGQKNARRILDEFEEDPESFDCDLIGPTAMKRYYQYAFFDRNQTEKMDFPLPATSFDRDDTLLSLLAENKKSKEEFLRINKNQPFNHYFAQSFMSAAKNFAAIDTPTQGVIVPYGSKGRELIGALCTEEDLAKRRKLLAQAQQYSVNLFNHERGRLPQGALVEVTQLGLFYLDERHYHEDFGFTLEPIGKMEVYFV